MPPARELRMKAKVCLVGEAAVGKTSLVRRFVINEFDDRYITTLGARVSKKEMRLDLTKEHAAVELDLTIWDIMGERGVKDLLQEAFFHGTKGVLAVCDITRYSTLGELDHWIDSVFQVAGQVPVVYAVNKLDLRDEVLLFFGEEEVRAAAAAYDAPYFFTSAKTGEKVEESFLALAREIVKRQVIVTTA